MTRCLLSAGSRHSVQPGENFSVKQLQLSTEISHQHLLLIIGQSVSQSTPQIFGTICDAGESGEDKTWTIIFYNIDNLTLLKRIPAPEVEAPSMDLNVKFFKSGIYIESMMTAEEDARLVLVGCYRRNVEVTLCHSQDQFLDLPQLRGGENWFLRLRVPGWTASGEEQDQRQHHQRLVALLINSPFTCSPLRKLFIYSLLS